MNLSVTGLFFQVIGLEVPTSLLALDAPSLFQE